MVGYGTLYRDRDCGVFSLLDAIMLKNIRVLYRERGILFVKRYINYMVALPSFLITCFEDPSSKSQCPLPPSMTSRSMSLKWSFASA